MSKKWLLPLIILLSACSPTKWDGVYRSVDHNNKPIMVRYKYDLTRLDSIVPVCQKYYHIDRDTVWIKKKP